MRILFGSAVLLSLALGGTAAAQQSTSLTRSEVTAIRAKLAHVRLVMRVRRVGHNRRGLHHGRSGHALRVTIDKPILAKERSRPCHGNDHGGVVEHRTVGVEPEKAPSVEFDQRPDGGADQPAELVGFRPAAGHICQPLPRGQHIGAHTR